MLSQNDLKTVYEFIKTTGEKNIRQMMLNPKMTANHINLLLKIVRSVKAEDFVTHCEKDSFPKVKYNNQEDAIKETFWKTACDTFVQLGLASPEAKAA